MKRDPDRERKLLLVDPVALPPTHGEVLDMDDLQLAHELHLTSEALSKEQRRIRDETFAALRRHYGLVAGETVLSHDGYVGIFQEILNFYAGKKPWVSVLLTEDSRPNRTRRAHFYHGWEKVQSV